MNVDFRKALAQIFTSFSPFHQVPVRYRYYADKIAKGPLVRKYGYEDKLFKSGVLPRLKDEKMLPRPIYKPVSPWTKQKATFGQNDYIDILGDGKIRPYDVCYNVPRWLRGKQGNELQLLLLKAKKFKHTDYEYGYPTAYNNIQKRIRYLYKFLNLKTKS